MHLPTCIHQASKVEEVPHPLDGQYNMLNCQLEHIPKTNKDFKLMNEYLNNTGSNSWRKMTLANLWKVDREDEVRRNVSFAIKE